MEPYLYLLREKMVVRYISFLCFATLSYFHQSIKYFPVSNTVIKNQLTCLVIFLFYSTLSVLPNSITQLLMPTKVDSPANTMEKPNRLNNLAIPVKRSPLWREGVETCRDNNNKINLDDSAEASCMNDTNFTLCHLHALFE